MELESINIAQFSEDEKDAVNIAACIFARELVGASKGTLSDSKIEKIVTEYWDGRKITAFCEKLMDEIGEEEVRDYFIRRVIRIYKMLKAGKPNPPILILDDKERHRVWAIAQKKIEQENRKKKESGKTP